MENTVETINCMYYGNLINWFRTRVRLGLRLSDSWYTGNRKTYSGEKNIKTYYCTITI